MKYCSNCGQPLREGVKVCTNCGKPVQQSKPNHSNTQQDYHNQSRQDKHEQHQYQGYNNHNQNGYADRHDQQPRKGDNKRLDYYCSYSCIANCFDRCIFSIKNQFFRKSKHLILHKQLRKMTKKH